MISPKPITHKPPGPISPPGPVSPSVSHANTAIDVTNTINNVNKINASVSLTNTNDVKIFITNPRSLINNTVVPYRNLTVINETITTRPSPTYIPYYVPYRRRCCTIVEPYIPQPRYRHECGNHCTGNFLYNSINPCQYHTCHRRRYSTRKICNTYYCENVVQDCSQCYENYYETYQDYQKCSGCFYY